MAPVETLPRPAELRDGRTLHVDASGPEDVVEVRAADGAMEIRIRLTDAGPVLEVEAARLALKASDTVEVECRDFKVRAHGDAEVQATGDVRVTGETIHLN